MMTVLLLMILILMMMARSVVDLIHVYDGVALAGNGTVTGIPAVPAAAAAAGDC